jgi:chemotaxis protein methyltransferase CheR
MTPDIDVEALEIRMLLEAIHARYGFDLRDYAHGSMRRQVLGALGKSGLSHLGELQHRVLSEPRFFAELLEDLTVRVTEMFRDPQVHRAFRERVVPILRTYPLLKIWHGGCASGEEAYGSAILLEEEGLYDRTQIYATDLSHAALEQAKLGLYPADRLEAFARNYALAGGKREPALYYTLAYDQLGLGASLKRNISFFQHDLVTDQVFGEMHVIFCRNVFIYFDPDLRDRVLAKFAQSLRPGGFLCLGVAERLTDPGRYNFSEFLPEERIYRYEG